MNINLILLVFIGNGFVCVLFILMLSYFKFYHCCCCNINFFLCEWLTSTKNGSRWNYIDGKTKKKKEIFLIFFLPLILKNLSEIKLKKKNGIIKLCFELHFPK